MRPPSRGPNGCGEWTEAICLPTLPGLDEQPPVHAREVAVALSQLAAEERHPLDDARVRQSPRVDVAEGRAVDEREEPLLRVAVVADHVDVARRTVEQRPIEHLPPDVLERADDPRRRKA